MRELETPVIFANRSALPFGRSLQPPGVMVKLVRVAVSLAKGLLSKAPLCQRGIEGGVGLQRSAPSCPRRWRCAATQVRQLPPWWGMRARFAGSAGLRQHARFAAALDVADDRLGRGKGAE